MTNGNSNGTKPVTETVRALAGTPMLLVLVLINLIILGMATYLIRGRSDAMQSERSELIKSLDGCVEQLIKCNGQ